MDSIYKDYFYAKLKAGYSSGFDLSQAYTAIQRRFQYPEQNEKQKASFLVIMILKKNFKLNFNYLSVI